MERERPGGVMSDGGSRARRRWRPTAVTAILLLAANSSCGLFESDSAGENSGTPTGAGTGGSGHSGAAGTAESGGSAGSGGLSIIGGGSTAAGGACAADETPLADQVVSQIGAQRVFYSWTTDEQVAELRAGGPLFSRSERPGMGRGLAFTELAAFAALGDTPQQKLAAELESDVFAKVRFTWTNPWATLLGWPGETYGTQLLEIELQPEAWIAVFDPNGLIVYDTQGEVVPIETALENPQRIGAIYYQSTSDEAANYCGTFSFGAVGFREFILGNLSMVKRWSLATPEIAQRVEEDIAALRAFEAMLSCVSLLDQGAWSSSVSCEWSEDHFPGSFLVDYEFALGIPSELYWPSQENIEALIAALEASMPTGEPLEVTVGG
jgi:hypothetical protein